MIRLRNPTTKPSQSHTTGGNHIQHATTNTSATNPKKRKAPDADLTSERMARSQTQQGFGDRRVRGSGFEQCSAIGPTQLPSQSRVLRSRKDDNAPVETAKPPVTTPAVVKSSVPMSKPTSKAPSTRMKTMGRKAPTPACDVCRQARRGCDRKTPVCGRCASLGLAHLCHYTHGKIIEPQPSDTAQTARNKPRTVLGDRIAQQGNQKAPSALQSADKEMAAQENTSAVPARNASNVKAKRRMIPDIDDYNVYMKLVAENKIFG